MASSLHVCKRLFKYSPNFISFRGSNKYGSAFLSTVNSNQTSTDSQSSPQPPPVSGSSSQEDSVTAKLQEENKILLDQIKVIDDKYKRSLAENENIRERMRKQIDETKRFGIQKFCTDMTDVADILSKAMEVVPKDELVDSNPHLKNLHQGLSMTEAQLQSVFRRHGLTLINPLNSKFDPNQHEALFEVDDAEKEPGTVAVVTKVGYRLHERTIRPALVGVIKKRL